MDALERYSTEGFWYARGVASADALDLFRDACDKRLRTRVQGMFSRPNPMDVTGELYFLEDAGIHDAAIEASLCDSWLTEFAMRFAGCDARCFYNQFVVKTARSSRSAVAWHQDGAYDASERSDYCSIWLALDAIGTSEGALSILPVHERDRRIESIARSEPFFPSADAIRVVEVDAGDAVVIHSSVFHQTGPNLSPGVRRVFLSCWR